MLGGGTCPADGSTGMTFIQEAKMANRLHSMLEIGYNCTSGITVVQEKLRQCQAAFALARVPTSPPTSTTNRERSHGNSDAPSRATSVQCGEKEGTRIYHRLALPPAHAIPDALEENTEFLLTWSSAFVFQTRLPKIGKSKPWLDGTLNSEYGKEFIEKEAPMARFKLPKACKNAAKFEGLTTNKADYLPHQQVKEQMMRPVNTYAVDSGLEFSGTSAYAAQFGPKEATYQRVKASNKYEPNLGEFYGTTTYGGAFAENKVPTRVARIEQPNHIQVETAPYEGHSVYKDNYTEHVSVQREIGVPRPSGITKPEGKFDGQSMYNANYVAKEVSVREQIKPQEGPSDRLGWCGGIPASEYGGQFVDKETPHFKVAKPARRANILGTGSFDGLTTSKQDYLTPQLDKGGIIRPTHSLELYKLPFNGESTYADQYVSKSSSYVRVLPDRQYVPNISSFDGDTTNKVAYKDFGTVPVYRGKAKVSAAFTKDGRQGFEGVSTYKDNFASMPAVTRTKPVIRASQPLREGQLDGVTTYNQDFKEKEIPQRVAYCRDGDSSGEED
eukprot:gene18834-25380_t